MSRSYGNVFLKTIYKSPRQIHEYSGFLTFLNFQLQQELLAVYEATVPSNTKKTSKLACCSTGVKSPTCTDVFLISWPRVERFAENLLYWLLLFSVSRSNLFGKQNYLFVAEQNKSTSDHHYSEQQTRFVKEGIVTSVSDMPITRVTKYATRSRMWWLKSVSVFSTGLLSI